MQNAGDSLSLSLKLRRTQARELSSAGPEKKDSEVTNANPSTSLKAFTHSTPAQGNPEPASGEHVEPAERMSFSNGQVASYTVP
jgi:hypothetical protein